MSNWRYFRESFWLAPFCVLILMALVLLRPWPGFPAPKHRQLVTDGRGVEVALPLPLRIVASPTDYLEVTHDPGKLFQASGPRGRADFAGEFMARLYPEIARNDRLWPSHPGTLEGLLASDDGGTYLTGSFLWELRRLGFACVQLLGETRGRDDLIYSATRVANRVLGQPERAEAFIRRYDEAVNALERELRPQTLDHLPRVLSMASASKDWTFIWAADLESTRVSDERTGVTNASVGYEDSGRLQEPERILAMNPDIIFEGRESVENFGRDARWQGLKAVLNHQVYRNPDMGIGIPTWRIDDGPLLARWEAEIAHPERLQPKLRWLLRDHYFAAYGYRLTDKEMDDMLRVRINAPSLGYARFSLPQ